MVRATISREVKDSLVVAPAESINDFVRDVDTLLKLTEDQLDGVIEYFKVLDEPLALDAETAAKPIAKAIGVRRDKAENIARLICFLLKILVSDKKSPRESISGDLKLLGFTTDEVATIVSTIDELLKKHPLLTQQLKKLARANAVIETVVSMDFAVDMRLVYEEGKGKSKLIGLVPVLVCQLGLKSDKERREVVFQLSKEKVEQYYEAIAEQRKRVLEASEFVTIKQRRNTK